MKPILALLAGLAATFTAFAGGIAFALVFLTAEPVPVQDLAMKPELHFPSEPVRIHPGEQPYERVAPAMTASVVPVKEEVREVAAESEPPEEAEMTDTPAPEEEIGLSAAHLEWCSRRYRSYDPQSNRYRPYDGGTRECVSPYSEEPEDQVIFEASASAGGDPETQEYEEAAAALSSHIASCFARYRSYRPEDNSYQPYGGGPRRQCE